MPEIRRERAPMALRALSLAALLIVTSAAPALAAGKPGYPDKVTWSGATWAIKTSRSAVGPGPNVFSKANVRVDGGDLHLQIAKDATGRWTCAEIIGPMSYGYGTYTFTLASPVNALDPNVVLGLFTWSDKAPYAHREIDIEFARWGTGGPTNAQFVVQPATTAGHLSRFIQGEAVPSTHSFTWQPGRISWESRDGNGGLIASYAYTGTDVPKPGDERVRLNLWLFNGAAPTDGAPVEVVVRSFAFTP
jgi:hypothetical protein